MMFTNSHIKTTKEHVKIDMGNQYVFAMLHRPLVSSPVPAVVICHGFGGNKVGSYRMLIRLSDALAAHGIASLRIDFRGSGDSDGDFENITIESQKQDLMAAFSYMDNCDWVDSSRIGACGRSLGSVIVLKVAHIYPRIKSLALWVPVFDTKQWHPKEKTDRPLTPVIINGHPVGPNMIPDFITLSVEEDLPLLDNIPMLQIFSDKDSLLDESHMKHYIEGRVGAKAETESLRLKEGDHRFSNVEDQKQVLDTTVNWFISTL